KKGALVTLDICGIDRELSSQIRDALADKHSLARDQIVLSCSHTHCGPVVGANLITMYPLDDAQRARIVDYARFLRTSVIDLVDRASAQLDDVALDWGVGRCDFAVNRRNNRENDVPALRGNLALAGPVDHDVPVLRVRALGGSPRVIVFGYACHCTVLDYYKFCGDHAGFAALDLEHEFPGCHAMFVAGCGGDQNPIPRRKLELARKYGAQLAGAVGRVVKGPMRSIRGPLRSAYQEIDLAFGTLPTRRQLEADAKSSNLAVSNRGRCWLEKLSDKGKLPVDYPYPVQAWGLDELCWVFLGGEATVDYALRIKRNVGSSHTWVSAYCNDVSAYIPSLRVLKEGGYEGATSMIYYGQPTVWSDRVEEQVIAGVSRVLGAIAPQRSRE
ncbi:MAG: neutral/alkaline non-lysosomal ceramidase N-terminal domain-containing protein, partial [Isosphaeraceae bacterium]